jgi:hypothetical protein
MPSFRAGLIARSAQVDTTPPNTIRALAGIFRLTGEDMIPTSGWVLPVGAGAFALAGQSATLTPPVAATTTWDAANKSANLTLSNGNLTSKNTVGSAHAGVRSVASHTTGKYYCELKADVQTFTAFSYFGVITAAQALSNFLGGTADSACVTGNGGVNCNGASIITPDNSADGYGQGAVCGMAVDLTAKKIWFWNSDGNRWNGTATGTQDPVTGAGGCSIAALNAGPYFVGNAIWQLNDQTTMNFGATNYALTGTKSGPTGFGNW